MPGWQNGARGEENNKNNDENRDFILDFKFEGVQKDDNNDNERFYIRF